ncbi:MAG: hypothetical protein LBU51_08275 [Bacteroidales bacterium]|jgi:AAA15 family ATPase/GTPase|nr:hypothetical protein [Bacteroidales bacterium]
MKKITFFLVTVLWISLSFSQSVQPDPRITEVFGQEKIDQWTINSPDSIIFYNFVVNYGYKIEPFPKEKMETMKDITPVFTLKPQFSGERSDFSVEGLKNINVLKYEFEIDSLQMTYYRIGTSTNMFSFYSRAAIMTLIKEGKTSLK